MSKVTLYDLPSKPPCQTWSYNPWKTRLVLNFKGVDYKTEWVEYPDLAPTFKAFGIPPHDPDGTDESPDYTSPAVKFDDGTYAMDSKKIARELEKRYPSPSLHLDDPIVANFSLAKFQKHLIPHVVPKVPKLLNERSEEYFNRTRAVRFGMPLAQVEKEKATEERWEEAKEGLVEMADLLRQKGGPCFLGTTVSYADFVFVSYLAFLKRVDEGVFKRFIAFDEAFEKVYNATKRWL